MKAYTVNKEECGQNLKLKFEIVVSGESLITFCLGSFRMIIGLLHSICKLLYFSNKIQPHKV